ncbi:MAG: hypothetical protein AAGB22_12425, partial [Bacteroidota bacterium]
QNLAAGDVYVFVEALVDSVNTIQKTAFFQVGSDPDLEMDTDGSGQFWLTFVPEEFLPINPGEVINSLTFVIRRKVFTSGADRVDEELDFVVGCVQ